jgi:hypothetical protein
MTTVTVLFFSITYDLRSLLRIVASKVCGKLTRKTQHTSQGARICSSMIRTVSRSVLPILAFLCIVHQAMGLSLGRRSRSRSITRPRLFATQLSAMGGDKKDARNSADEDVRGDSLRRAMNSFAEVTTDEVEGLRAGSTVVPTCDIPSLGIWQFQTYELQSIFDQGYQQDTIIEKIPAPNLTDPITRPGYTRYITLYSPKYHKEPITITPEEVGLVSMRDEVMDSLLMALPIFGFWTAVAISFANIYTERYGGNFLDAFFRT